MHSQINTHIFTTNVVAMYICTFLHSWLRSYVLSYHLKVTDATYLIFFYKTLTKSYMTMLNELII